MNPANLSGTGGTWSWTGDFTILQSSGTTLETAPNGFKYVDVTYPGNGNNIQISSTTTFNPNVNGFTFFAILTNLKQNNGIVGQIIGFYSSELFHVQNNKFMNISYTNTSNELRVAIFNGNVGNSFTTILPDINEFALLSIIYDNTINSMKLFVNDNKIPKISFTHNWGMDILKWFDFGSRTQGDWRNSVGVHEIIAFNTCLNSEKFNEVWGILNSYRLNIKTIENGHILKYNGTNWIPSYKINTSTIPPTVSDDNTLGYEIGSKWYDTTNQNEYVCVNTSTNSAIWKETTNSQSKSYASYLHSSATIYSVVMPTANTFVKIVPDVAPILIAQNNFSIVSSGTLRYTGSQTIMVNVKFGMSIRPSASYILSVVLQKNSINTDTYVFDGGQLGQNGNTISYNTIIELSTNDTIDMYMSSTTNSSSIDSLLYHLCIIQI